jgi:hypothetical protein
MNEEKIYPDTDASEIMEKATKSHLGHFVKQYKKGDFLYTIERKPFKQMIIATVYIPTKKVFCYSNLFGTWDELDFKWE